MQGHIALVGMMGVGKTAVGQEIARQLGVPFHDSDAEIERAAAMTIPEIFDRDGEAFFRRRESEVLARILSGARGVVSTGGGAWIQPQNRTLLREHAISIWLDADLDTLWHRVKLRPTRPLLMTDDPRGTLAKLIETRSPVYARADLRVRTDSKSDIETSARRVIAAIGRIRPEFLEGS
ncbi:shikimate kinase [Paracoccus sp. SCSIO 75233]|uniref:shikimate kinase n=1 Tax=Paracoccus sp. SCSIO 75233 TaxID=3017782 RepID=UPI0022F1269F|nr:shikimate kinase [Paracoccus sp. SCSIO 75233]WBU54186.1 shikimate kinase [Paracoccus sp. SCSIO 75233]